MAHSEKAVIGVDLGGTTVKAGIVTPDGKIRKKISLPTNAENGPKAVISQIKKSISDLIDKKKYKIKGIGIGSPGVISLKKGTVEYPPNFPGWGKIHLGKQINSKFGVPVYVENDANAAAIGEMMFGAGSNLESFIMVTLGTGVGGGVILDRKILRGETGGAGELGHMTIDYKGPDCNCGSKGCIEAYTGINYLIEDVKEELAEQQNSLLYKIYKESPDDLTPKMISEAAAKEDQYAISVIKRTGFRLGCSLASAANLLDISSYIIGGGVAGFGKTLFDEVKNTIKQRTVRSLSPRIKVKPAKLKNEAGIKGAAALVYTSKKIKNK